MSNKNVALLLLFSININSSFSFLFLCVISNYNELHSAGGTGAKEGSTNIFTDNKENNPLTITIYKYNKHCDLKHNSALMTQ